MKVDKIKLLLLTSSILGSFIVMRVYLYFSPGTNFDVGPYNIHHLFTGLLLIVIAGIPLVITKTRSKLDNYAIVVFGLGLSLALDEWVYLIATEGTDADYLSPVSLWGGIIMILAACAYSFVLYLVLNRNKRTIKS